MSEPTDTTNGSAVDRLRAAWITHVDSDATLFERLVGRHREKHRRYHRLDHVDHVVREVISLSATEDVTADDLDVAIASALYHDAVYEPRSPANERASARLARRDLAALGWHTRRVDAVATMIEGTATHAAPPNPATAVLFDADLAILGAAPLDYERYRSAVREEYGHIDEDAWRAGRPAVLRSFLDRSAIYATATARARWEVQARRNLSAEVEALTAEP